MAKPGTKGTKTKKTGKKTRATRQTADSPPPPRSPTPLRWLLSEVDPKTPLNDMLRRAHERGVLLYFRTRLLGDHRWTQPPEALEWSRVGDVDEDVSFGLEPVFEALVPLPPGRVMALIDGAAPVIDAIEISLHPSAMPGAEPDEDTGLVGYLAEVVGGGPPVMAKNLVVTEEGRAALLGRPTTPSGTAKAEKTDRKLAWVLMNMLAHTKLDPRKDSREKPSWSVLGERVAEFSRFHDDAAVFVNAENLLVQPRERAG